MSKVWAIIDYIGSDYMAYYPIVLSDSLEAIKTYIKENDLIDIIIAYKELDGVFKCGYDEGDDTKPDWNYWDGERNLGHTWKNIKTGEIDPDFESREDIPEEEYDDWEDGYMFEVYKDGKLVKTYLW
jgi:hypothetical protein